jgi:hypothetical protein
MHIPYISLIKKEKCADSKYYTLNKYGGIILMSKLDFLEISRYIESYYRTLRDVHYYLTNDSEVSPEELQAVSKVLSKLIYGFIRVNGKAFREMNSEQYEQAYHLFHQDFLSVIQKSGENNVDFDQFTALIDEIIGIAVKRTIALGKIKKVKQESFLEDDEIVEVTDAESELSNENDEIVAEDEVVVDVIEVIDEIKDAVPEVETLSAVVETLITEVEGVLDKDGDRGDEKQESENISVVVNDVKLAAVTSKKVNNNFVDAGPVANNFNDYESSDNFRFRPRRRKNR